MHIPWHFSFTNNTLLAAGTCRKWVTWRCLISCARTFLDPVIFVGGMISTFQSCPHSIRHSPCLRTESWKCTVSSLRTSPATWSTNMEMRPGTRSAGWPASIPRPFRSIRQVFSFLSKLASCLPQLFTVCFCRSTQSSYSGELPKRPSLSWAVMIMNFLKAWVASSWVS